MDNHNHIQSLLSQPALSPADQQYLLDHEDELRLLMQENFILQKDNSAYSAHAVVMLEQWRTKNIHSNTTLLTSPQKPSIIRLKWLHYTAAAILILVIGSGVYYFSNQSSKSNAISGGTGGTIGDIAPGTNRAILTINDNQKIDLATNKTGININNSITYSDGEKIADAGKMLQLTTPRGGQYQATLPDGSKVWLNAASSIKFPSVFDDKERKIEVTGEVYLEVAKNLHAPFSVSTGNTIIQVLGTSFNINAYPDEESQRTTLISGSVRVVSNNQQVILKPGQTASIKESIKLIKEEDLEHIIAWKNGLFNFTGKSFASLMKDIERWYDVQVKYEDAIPTFKLKGKMDRGIKLSEWMHFLQQDKVQMRLDGRTLIISSQ